MRHALVVGGTGMLSAVTIWLENNGYHVSVIARDVQRMEKVIAKSQRPSRITPVMVDYRNHNELRKRLSEVSEKHGAIDLVVAWIHSDAKHALHIINQVIAKSTHHWNLFHVLGSSADLLQFKQTSPHSEHCNYHQIQLGFVIEHNHSRWLSNKEISDGVIEAIKKGVPTYTVGVMEPWELRP
ncbi:SDR family NAD(P)-dependent oxidoreductase [Bacillus ginsengihumi]|uniref:SDR family NAD(P)-dependent oxidoreductase n=1 Tax=Heyndrickxia ginsengihumi TaxID=363870 RepID=A0A0A6Y1U6_9BACI|nr:short-chain dehydrogenase [Heyndrickxia ginsengihumi]KHD86247.1 short-chain dehydrogenase [Heyndrickxia ginsengihumi]NEY20232.1 SDR family NAD(P)-dependent oxidoreductase [Heyndrickxia ginsengihumi]